MYAAPVHGVQSKAARPRRFPEKWFLGGLSANQKRTHHLCDVCVFYAAALYARSSAADSGCPVRAADAPQPVQTRGVVREAVDAPVARQRRLKAHAAQDLIRPVAVFPVGVGKGVRCAAGILRELILQALQVRAEQLRIVRLRLARVRQAAVALRRVTVQVVGVVLHLDEAGVEHLVELVPCDVRIVDALTRPLGEIVRVAPEQRKDDVRRILPQQRQHIDVVVVVPVVKAEHDGLFRQRRTVAHIGDDVRHDDGRVAIFRQPPEVGFQLPRLDGILAGLVGLDLVVHDDRQRHGVRLLPGGIGRKRAEHEQRRQHDGHHPLRDRSARRTASISSRFIRSEIVCAERAKIMHALRVSQRRAARI